MELVLAPVMFIVVIAMMIFGMNMMLMMLPFIIVLAVIGGIFSLSVFQILVLAAIYFAYKKLI